MNPEGQVVTIIGVTTALVLSLYVLLPYISNIGSTPKGPVVPGLRNWANWCFCNSVLQSLSALPSFKSWLDEHIDEKVMRDADEIAPSEKVEQEMGGPFPLTRTMQGMAHVLNLEGPGKVLSSSPLVQALESVQGTRISRAQQDAQEFLHMLLESIAAEQNRVPATRSIQQMAADCARAGTRYVQLPFEGRLRHASVCLRCGHELRVQTTPTLELTLLPPPAQSRVTLERCLAAMLEPERIEDYNCARCQLALLESRGLDVTVHRARLAADPEYDLPAQLPRSSVTLERTTTVLEAPHVLVLHINRSLFGGHYATRNAVDVTYEPVLAFAGEQYRLRSFVTHRGSHERGHYVAHRRKGRRWYVISDETVRVTDEAGAMSMGAATFLMFYERVVPETLQEKQERQEKKKEKKRKKQRRRESGGQGELVIDSKI